MTNYVRQSLALGPGYEFDHFAGGRYKYIGLDRSRQPGYIMAHFQLVAGKGHCSEYWAAVE